MYHLYNKFSQNALDEHWVLCSLTRETVTCVVKGRLGKSTPQCDRSDDGRSDGQSSDFDASGTTAEGDAGGRGR